MKRPTPDNTNNKDTNNKLQPPKKKQRIFVPNEIWTMICSHFADATSSRVSVLLTANNHVLPQQMKRLHETYKRESFNKLFLGNKTIKNIIDLLDGEKYKRHNIPLMFNLLYNTMGKPTSYKQLLYLRDILTISLRENFHENVSGIRISENTTSKDPLLISMGISIPRTGKCQGKYFTPMKPSIGSIFLCRKFNQIYVTMVCFRFDVTSLQDYEPKNLKILQKKVQMFLKKVCLGLGIHISDPIVAASVYIGYPTLRDNILKHICNNKTFATSTI